MPWLPEFPKVANATFTVQDGAGGGGAPFAVQFNPASLEYSITAEFENRNANSGARQFVKKPSAKLTMTLLFDTTTTGASVCDVTANLALLLKPEADGKKKVASKVLFSWGSFSFTGVVEQYKETIDFFSADGVPLRSSLNLTLASQEVEFQSEGSPAPSVDRNSPPEPVATGSGATPAGVAAQAGAPRTARDIASASGAESLRAGAQAGLSVGGSVSLSAAAAFSVGGGAGLGGGGGIGAGIGGGAGLGVGVGGGLGLGVSAGAGVGFSAGASLSIGATAGAAFGGLRVSPPTATLSIGQARAALLPAPSAAAGARFGLGGRAVVQGGGSLSADVGAGASARAQGRITFGD